MERHTRTTFSGLVAILAILLIALVQPSTAKSVAYCSSQNTGSDNAAEFWTWQSNGWCNDKCKDSHPFGVILGSNCWCSDYIPAEQEDVSECSDQCNGFPSEDCGNESKGLYIYIRLDSNAEIKGTQGASQPTSSSVSPSSTANPVASSSAAPSSSEVKTSQPPPASSTTLKTTTAAPSSSSSIDAPLDTSPFTSVEVRTESGVVITKTVVTTPTSIPAVAGDQKKGTNTGAIVGGVVGGLAVLGAIVGAVIFLLFRRRRQHREEEDGSGMQRNTSTMSRSGLIGGGEKGPQHPPKIATTFSSRHSRNLDNDSISPISGSDRRNSRLVFDQRLNPSALMVLDNPSRESFVSMDDSRDYGRTLNVRNPDQNNG